jgi:hypothetical protein
MGSLPAGTNQDIPRRLGHGSRPNLLLVPFEATPRQKQNMLMAQNGLPNPLAYVLICPAIHMTLVLHSKIIDVSPVSLPMLCFCACKSGSTMMLDTSAFRTNPWPLARTGRRRHPFVYILSVRAGKGHKELGQNI